MIRRHPELILFGVIAAVYIVCTTPDFTWVSMDCDGFYFYSQVVHLVDWGARPVFVGIGNVLTRIPLGDLPWRVAFFTATVPAIVTTALIFYAVRKQTINKWAPHVASVAFAASPVIISQATVHEVYLMTTMFCVAAYLAHAYNRHFLSLIMVGLAFCTHWTTVVPVVVAFMMWAPSKRRLVILVPFLAAPFLLQKFWGTYPMLSYWAMLPSTLMQIFVSDLPRRFVQSLGVLALTLGVAWIPAALYLRDFKRTLPFFIIMSFPVFHLFTGTTIEAYVQLCVATPFLAIAAGLGIERLQLRRLVPAVAVACSLVMVLVTPAFWDIGRTLDENPTTARQWLNQLAELEPNSVVITSRQFEGVEDSHGVLAQSAGVMLNHEGHHINYMNPDAYIFRNDELGERARLSALGYATPYVELQWDWDYPRLKEENTQAFANANSGAFPVYRTIITNERTQECELIRVEPQS